jgi:hypothetical protein
VFGYGEAMSTDVPQLPQGYPAFLAELKQRIRNARLHAALSVNRELILLYWSIGRDILARQHAEGWGSKVSTDWPPIFAEPFGK